MLLSFFKKPKTPDYLKTIKIILAVIAVFFVILILSATTSTKPKLGLNNSYLKNTSNIISENLISYIKPTSATIPQINNNSPILGDKNASITIFEFSSFGCAYSAQIQPIIKGVLKKYPKTVKLVWKDLPLSDIYPNADLAHVAARCAQAQDKFWQYHDFLWDNQKKFDRPTIEAVARQVDLDLNKFKTCLSDDNIKTIINNDVKEADSLSISGTPHFYINNQELTGMVSAEDFDAVIAAELARQKK